MISISSDSVWYVSGPSANDETHRKRVCQLFDVYENLSKHRQKNILNEHKFISFAKSKAENRIWYTGDADMTMAMFACNI